MSPLITASAIWLHNLATVVFIGYFVVLAVICLPALDACAETRAAAISAISKRSRPWLYGSLVVFALSGSYLTLTDPAYMGLGNFTSPWALLMLAKHLLIVAMLAFGFWFNAILRVGPQAASNAGAAAIARFRNYARLQALTGAAVLLMTGIAQAL
jgi:uncharacterized membrane protein